jgi:hypothetical protein
VGIRWAGDVAEFQKSARRGKIMAKVQNPWEISKDIGMGYQ